MNKATATAAKPATTASTAKPAATPAAAAKPATPTSPAKPTAAKTVAAAAPATKSTATASTAAASAAKPAAAATAATAAKPAAAASASKPSSTTTIQESKGKAQVGKPFVDMDCVEVVSGKKKSLKETIKGKNAVVVFIDCDFAASAPAAARLEDDAFSHKSDSSIVFILVNMDSADDAKKFHSEQSIKNVVHLVIGAKAKVPAEYGVLRPPHYLIIGKSGKVLLCDEEAFDYMSILEQ